MDPLTALALSVPPSMALYFAARILGHHFHRGLLTFARNLNDGVVAVAGKGCEAIENSAETLAQATVRAARYESKSIRPRAKLDKPGAVTPFDLWLAHDGKSMPESVRDQVDWACGKLAGTEGEQEGDDSDALRILRTWAPGLEAAIREKVATGG